MKVMNCIYCTLIAGIDLRFKLDAKHTI